MSYSVFVRNWWKENPSWPNGLEPSPGKRTYLARDIETEQEARAMCREYCEAHAPGRLSRKAEYQSN